MDRFVDGVVNTGKEQLFPSGTGGDTEYNLTNCYEYFFFWYRIRNKPNVSATLLNTTKIIILYFCIYLQYPDTIHTGTLLPQVVGKNMSKLYVVRGHFLSSHSKKKNVFFRQCRR